MVIWSTNEWKKKSIFTNQNNINLVTNNSCISSTLLVIFNLISKERRTTCTTFYLLILWWLLPHPQHSYSAPGATQHPAQCQCCWSWRLLGRNWMENSSFFGIFCDERFAVLFQIISIMVKFGEWHMQEWPCLHLVQIALTLFKTFPYLIWITLLKTYVQHAHQCNLLLWYQ